jgi:hypothetical protein
MHNMKYFFNKNNQTIQEPKKISMGKIFFQGEIDYRNHYVKVLFFKTPRSI